MGLKRLLSSLNGEVLAVYSENEKDQCDRFGFRSVWSENFPVGRKHNNGLVEALKLDWDYLVNVGSDDLINPELFDLYGNHEAQGLLKVHLYNTETGEAGVFKNNYPLGAGRMIRRDVVEDLGTMWKIQTKCSMAGPGGCFGKGQHVFTKRFAQRLIKDGCELIEEIKGQPRLWANDQNSALDHSSETILLTNGVKQKSYDTDKVLVVDLKSGTNIWSFDNYLKADIDVLKFVSKEERNAIRKLR